MEQDTNQYGLIAIVIGEYGHNTLIHLYGEAGVSKATLYNNDVLKERILRLRAIEKSAANGVIIATPKDKIQAKDDKIKQLYEEIKNLKKINRI